MTVSKTTSRPKPPPPPPRVVKAPAARVGGAPATKAPAAQPMTPAERKVAAVRQRGAADDRLHAGDAAVRGKLNRPADPLTGPGGRPLTPLEDILAAGRAPAGARGAVSSGGPATSPAEGGPAAAVADYEALKQAGPGGDPASWGREQAEQFTSGLAEKMEAHRDDPAYQRALLQLSEGELRRSTELLADASDHETEPKEVTRDLASNFARIGSAAPADARDQLAWSLADAIPDHKDFYQVDDGLTQSEERHGTGPFLDALEGAFAAQDKGLAREEVRGSVNLLEHGLDIAGDVVDSAKDRFGDLVDGARDAWDFGFAALTRDHDALVGQVGDALNIPDKVNDLEPGDSVMLGASSKVGAGVTVGAEGDIKVTRNDDGTYSVSAQVEAELGGKLFAGGDVGVGLKGEFKFDNPEDAARAASILATAGVGLSQAGNPLLAPLAAGFAPSGDDISFLKDHTTAIELGADVAASVDAEAGVDNVAGAGASAEAEAGGSVRIEFEDGKPSAIVRVSEVEVSATGSAQAVVQGLGTPLTDEIKEKTGLDVAGGAELELTAKLRTEARYPLEGNEDLDDLLTNTAGFVTGVAPEYKVTAEVEGTANNVGFNVTVSADKVTPGDAASLVTRAARGDLAGAFNVLRREGEGKLTTFSDEGFDFGLDLTVGGVGIEGELHNQTRRITHEREFL